MRGMIYMAGASPPDHARLIDWAESRPGVESFKTERQGSDIWVRAEHRKLAQSWIFIA
jgi:hypothetical protein